MRSKQRAYLYSLYFAAVVYLVYLLSSTQLYSFYSGDGGLKFIALKQICASEDFRYIADTHSGWVKNIWEQGFFPIQEPFVLPTSKGYQFIFPMGFQFINAFFYKQWGYLGLYVIPVLSLLLLWYWFIQTSIKLSFSTKQTAVLFFVLAFCSPLSLYGVVYWEHITGMLFMFAGVRYLLCPPRRGWAGLLLGVLSGLAAWLRPESMFINFLVLIAVVVLSFRRPAHSHWLFALGIVAGTGSFLLFNKEEYGYFFGVHGLQVLTAHHYFQGTNQLVNIFRANLALLEYFPVTLLLVPIVVGWLVWKRALGWMPASLLLICGFYCSFCMLMCPNDGQIGGKQWGSRYLLPVVTIIPFVLASVYNEWERTIPARYKRLLMGLFALAVVAGFILNTVIGSVNFRRENFQRVSPALHFALADAQDTVIVVNSQYVTMEMGALFDQRSFFWAPDTVNFQRLIPLLKSRGVDDFLYINHGGLPNGFTRIMSAYGTVEDDIGSYKMARFSLKGRPSKLPPDILSQHTNKDR